MTGARRPGRPRRNGGYALLLVLLALALATAAAVGLSRSAMSARAAADEAGTDLQRRWGVLSCRAALLPEAERLLGAGPAERRFDVRLGGQAFTAIVTDEQAKLNVNALFALSGLAAADRSLRGAAAAGGSMLTPRLSPAAVVVAPDTFPLKVAARAFGGFGQIFPDAPPAALRGPDAGSGPASDLTLWGDGRLNARRASPDAIARLCADLLERGQVEALVAALRANPAASPAAAAARLGWRDSVREAVAERLTDESDCHGLWVIDAAGGRRWYTLAVEDDSRPDRRVDFDW